MSNKTKVYKAWHTHKVGDLFLQAESLKQALTDLLEVCHCTNGCAPDDMNCASNRARVALENYENMCLEKEK